MKRIVLAVILALCGVAPAPAQLTISRPTINVIVPEGAGGTTDLLARLIADKMGKILGETVIVENKPGATGIIGIQACAEMSKPDGKTVCLVGSGGAVIVPAAYMAASESLPYRGLNAIGRLGDSIVELIVRKDLPVSFGEFLEYAKEYSKKDPKGLPCAWGFPVSRLGLELLNKIEGVKINVISGYPGSGPALNDIEGGRLDCMFANMFEATSYVERGAVNPLGTIGTRNNTLLPEGKHTKPLTEQGYADYAKIPTWFGLFGPAGIPEDRIAVLNKALNETLRDEEVTRRLKVMGTVPRGSTPEELRKLVAVQISDMIKLMCRDRIELIQGHFKEPYKGCAGGK